MLIIYYITHPQGYGERIQDADPGATFDSQHLKPLRSNRKTALA